MLIGNVGKDPEVRYLDGNNGMSGNAKVATLTLATTERFRDRNGSEIREKTEWHNIVAWRSLADLAEKFIRKGTQIYVEEIHYRGSGGQHTAARKEKRQHCKPSPAPDAASAANASAASGSCCPCSSAY